MITTSNIEVKNKKEQPKTDAVWIFFAFWGVATGTLIMVFGILYFIVMSALLYLIDRAGDAVIPPSQNLNLILKFIPPLVGYMIVIGLIWATLMVFYNNKDHQPFRQSNGQLPIFRVQKAEIITKIDYPTAFSLCMDSIEKLEKDESRIVESNLHLGIISVVVKLKKYGKLGETVKFHLEKLSSNEVKIYITSASNVLLKGLDGAKNIKNIYAICDFLKQEVSSERIEVRTCLP